MRVLRSSVLLCLLILVFTPAPAHAWFEWLDRLSGPGYWYGLKVDVRAKCFGTAVPGGRTPLTQRLAPAQLQAKVLLDDDVREEFLAELRQLSRIALSLGIASADRVQNIESGFKEGVSQGIANPLLKLMNEEQLSVEFAKDPDTKLARAAAETIVLREQVTTTLAALGGGLLVDLCPSGEKERTFAIHYGYSWMFTGGNPTYANDKMIELHNVTVGFSYRIPVSIHRDFIDLGTTVGIYRFYSRGFDDFSGWTIEPFVDLHPPTSFRHDQPSKAKRFLGRFSLRAGLLFFPGGFKAEQFASQPGTPNISGREANPSVTVFFKVKG